MHKANYAVLEDDKDLGIKYCPHISFEDEFFILKELNHKQIPRAYEYGYGTMYKDDKIVLNQHYIVIDHLGNVDLVAYFIQKTTESFTDHLESLIKSFISVCAPLSYLHSKNYLHLDIKPGHLMLDVDTCTCFLIDYELVTKKAGIIHGISKDYASPEHENLLKFLRDPPKGVPHDAIASNIAIDERADIYSFGAVLFETVTQKKWKEVKSAPRTFNALIPCGLERIIMAALEDDRENRIATVKQLARELENIL